MTTRISLAMLAMALAMVLPTVRAEEEEAPDYAERTLSGDWDGARTAAWRAGWTFDAAIRIDALRSRGGNNPGHGVISDLDLILRADLEKAVGWKDATLYFHVLDNRGDDINIKSVGALAGVSNIAVPVATTRLFHAWLQQNFLDDQLSLLAGIYPIDSEFFLVQSALLMTNPSFGTPADVALTRGPSIFNNAAFGLRGKWLSADRVLYGMVAVLDGVPNDPDHPKRTAVKISGQDGAFGIAEFGWKPMERGHTFEPVEPVGGLPTPMLVHHEKYTGFSKYAVGFWGYSKGNDDLVATTASGVPLTRRQRGAYVFGEHTLFDLGDPGRDVTPFARWTQSDGNSIALDRTGNLGILVRGPLASRPNDAMTVGWTRSFLSPKYRAAQMDAGVETVPHEDVYEAAYRIALTHYLLLQPVAASISHPGGASSARRANVFGARLELAL